MSESKPPFIPVCEPTLGETERRYVADAMETGWISSAGAYLDRFEKDFAPKVGAHYGVATCNVTTALHLALKALGVGPGDEVILPSFTMIASANAVLYCGATPVFVDATSDTWTLNVEQLEQARTSRTKALMTVTIYGHPSDFDAVKSFCNQHQIAWLEDAAEGHGAEYKKTPLAALPDATAYSFFANKIISTGEGGMVCTNRSEIADQLRFLKNLAFPLKGPRNYVHTAVGFNYRMTNLQAALGCAQTERMHELVEMRRTNAHYYSQQLSASGLEELLQLPVEKPWAKNCYWMYGVVLKRDVKKSRDEIMIALKEKGIDTRPFFFPMHLQPILKSGQSLPVSENLGQRGFYLPSSSHLKRDQMGRVVESLKQVLR